MRDVTREIHVQGNSARSTFLQAQLVLLKDLAICWTNTFVLANQGLVNSLCFVAGLSDAIIDTKGRHLM